MAVNAVWIAAYGGPPPAAIGAAPVWIAPNDGSVPAATEVLVVGYGGPVAGASPIWIAAYGGPPPATIGATPVWFGIYGSSGGSSPPPTAPPVNITPPVISGTPQVGQTLTITDNGTWQNGPIIGYYIFWYNDNGKIAGHEGTVTTYVLQSSDIGLNVRVLVQAQNVVDWGQAFSNSLGPVTPPVSKPFAVIAAVSSNNVSGPSTPIDTTGADLLVVNLAATGSVSATIIDSYSNTWLTAIEGPFGDALYYCQGGVVGPGHTFQMSTLRSFPAMSVSAFSGSMANPLDQSAAGPQGGPVGPITPSVSNTLVITGLCTNDEGSTPPGFTALTGIPVSANFGSYLAYQTQGAPTEVTAAWGGTAQVQAVIASFKLAQAPPPPPSSVWSADDAAANGMTLSNGGLAVLNGPTINKSIRGTVSRTSGKVYVEFLAGAIAVGNERIGLADGINFIVSNQIGNSIYSGGYAYITQGCSAGFTSRYTTSLYPAANDVWALAVDFAAGNMWLAINNVWINGSDPATGLLPMVSFVLATVGALFPALTMQGAGEGPWTLQATAASQKYAPPAGFSPWG